MTIGVPSEIKDHETRVGLVPGGAAALTEAGHRVLVQAGAGVNSGFADDEYAAAGAEILRAAGDVWNRADLVVKVKEPQPPEYVHFRPGLILFTYLHLAPLPGLTQALVDSGTTAVAYETIQLDDGSLPLLTPMSEVAGRLAVQVGARYLEAPSGGSGVLLGGIPGVRPARVLILGAGVAGRSAARIARGLGARVTMVDRNLHRLREIEDVFSGDVETLAATAWAIREAIRDADLVVGCVLIPGAAAPKLVRRDMLARMKRRAVLVDVSIDQGGCFETSKPTTHSDPVFSIDDVLHYCVSNMPAAAPRTSTLGLTNATLPYLLGIAESGLAEACRRNPAILRGVNTHAGEITCPPVAESQGKPWREPRSLF